MAVKAVAGAAAGGGSVRVSECAFGKAASEAGAAELSRSKGCCELVGHAYGGARGGGAALGRREAGRTSCQECEQGRGLKGVGGSRTQARAMAADMVALRH